MELYGSLESLLDYSLPALSNYSDVQEGKEGDGEDDALEHLLKDKVECLSNIIAQIERDIKTRKELSDEVQRLIDRDYCYLKTKLYEIEHWQFGANRSIESRRSGLEKQLDTLNQETRKEQVECWKDIAGLAKEFRIWFKQYCDLVQRVRIIASDMNRKRRSPTWLE